MEVRLATADDADDLFLLNALFGNETTIERVKRALRENVGEVLCIAHVGGAAAGYCGALIVSSMCYGEDRADIEALFVREEYRRQGVGEALIQCLEAALLGLGVRHFHIVTGADNGNAQSLYARLGYAKTGEILLDKSIPSD